MNEVMTRAEAEAQFPNEWVLMANPEADQGMNYRGEIIAHEKDKAELLRKAKERPLPRRVAVFYTGPVVPPGMKVLM
jgi:hypothetical protein